MLEQFFPNLKGNRVISKMAELYRSPWYLVLIAVLIAWSALFGHEFVIYPILIALMGVGLLVSEDSRPALPVVLFGYVSVAHDHNPIKATGSLFYQKWFQTELIIVLSVGVAFLLVRAALSILKGAKLHPRMLGGMLFLSLAYLLGGLGNFSTRSFVFGIVQCASLLFCYLLFLFTIDWEKMERDYLPFAFLVLGLIVALQIADMYTHNGVFVGGDVDREQLFTGWGVYNNVACVMAMCIPAPCYFAATKKDGWKFTVLMAIFYFCTLLTQSRGGMLFGTVTFFACSGYLVFRRGGKNCGGHVAVFICMLTGVFIAVLSFGAQLEALFASVIRAGTDSSGRLDIYKNCFEAFLREPCFGVGFYDTPGFAFQSVGGFMPPRAHNTIFQLLASCGAFGLITYLVHRADTLYLFFKGPTPLKSFCFFVTLALVSTSLLDCNFFNIGPVLLYSVALAFAENVDFAPRHVKMLKINTL